MERDFNSEVSESKRHKASWKKYLFGILAITGLVNLGLVYNDEAAFNSYLQEQMDQAAAPVVMTFSLEQQALIAEAWRLHPLPSIIDPAGPFVNNEAQQASTALVKRQQVADQIMNAGSDFGPMHLPLSIRDRDQLWAYLSVLVTAVGVLGWGMRHERKL